MSTLIGGLIPFAGMVGLIGALVLPGFLVDQS